MLKLKKIDLLIKNDKIHKKRILWPRTRNLSACVEKSGELGWVVGCILGGERWDGKEKKEEEGETEEESVGRGGTYIMAFTDGLTDGKFPSVIPPVKVPRHCTTISVWIPLWYPTSEASVQSQGLISACLPWLVRHV